MQLLDELRTEHALIERVLGSLRAYVALRVDGAGDPGAGDPKDAASFFTFFRTWAGHYHHAREEDVLFEALVRDLGLPRHRGPIAVLSEQHSAMASILDTMAPILLSARIDANNVAVVTDLAVRYSRALWSHIDAENSVLFPECQARLANQGIYELQGRPATREELEARDGGEILTARYAPLVDKDAMRGDGCVVCPAYGESCDGVEREWWSEHEWEDFFHRNG